MRQYETTFIVDAHLADDQIEKKIEKYQKFLENSGAVGAMPSCQSPDRVPPVSSHNDLNTP